MEWLRQASRRTAERLETLPPTVRWSLIGGLAAVLVAASLLSPPQGQHADTYLVGEPLPASQLPAVEAALAQAGLSDYQLEGQRIKVPAAVKHRYLAALLEADLLPRDFGERLDDAIDGGSPFDSREQKRERIRHARQRELAQIIAEMKGIETARVLYDQGQSGGIGRQSILTASVSARASQDRALTLKQVRAMRHLVASAIAGLEPHQVSVTDLNTGRNYNGPEVANPRWLAELRAEHAGEVADRWRREIEQRAGIPGLSVEVAVDLQQPPSDGDDQDPLGHPSAARVTLRVPRSHVDQMWRRQTHIADDHRAPPTPAGELQALRDQLAAELETTIRSLLPAGVALDLHLSLDEQQTATATSPPAATRRPPPVWPLIGLTLLAGVGMVALWWLQQHQAAELPARLPTRVQLAPLPEEKPPAPRRLSLDNLAAEVAQREAAAAEPFVETPVAKSEPAAVVPEPTPSSPQPVGGLPQATVSSTEPTRPAVNASRGWQPADSRLVPGPQIVGLELNELTACQLAPGRKASNPLSRPATRRPMEYLKQVSPDQLAEFLQQESSQVIAVVFSRLDPTLAARVLKRLPDPLQVDVVGRLENLDQISEEVAGQIEQNLQTWFADHRQRSQRRQVGQEVVKQIMRRAGHDTRRLITAGRKATAPPTEPAAAVAAGPAPTAPGSFAHVLQLDDRSLGRLLCAADPQDVVMALAGSPSDVIDRALRTMKPRAADRLREALGRLDTSQLPDVFRSQQKIADLAAELGRSSRRAKPAPAVAVSS